MHGRAAKAVGAELDFAAGVKRRRFERAGEARRFAAGFAFDAPDRARQRRARRRRAVLQCAVWSDPHGHIKFAAGARFAMIEHHAAIAIMLARPMPGAKAGLQRLQALIAIKIAGAAPAQIRGAEIKLDVAPRRQGLPEMFS